MANTHGWYIFFKHLHPFYIFIAFGLSDIINNNTKSSVIYSSPIRGYKSQNLSEGAEEGSASAES